MAIDGHGLKYLSVDAPTAASELMDKERRNGPQLEIAGIEVRTLNEVGFFALRCRRL